MSYIENDRNPPGPIGLSNFALDKERQEAGE